MKVNIYRATITVDEKEERLTKAIAKQFPVLPEYTRWDQSTSGRPRPEPICKINGESIGNIGWLYLVEDYEAGLAWVSPLDLNLDMQLSLNFKGLWIDTPRSVPTVIL